MQCTRVAFIVELASNILIFTSLLLTKDLILLSGDGVLGRYVLPSWNATLPPQMCEEKGISPQLRDTDYLA